MALAFPPPAWTLSQSPADDRRGKQRKKQMNNHNSHANPQHLAAEKITGERKCFFIDLKENDRGRVFKITEDVRGRRDTIMLPVELAQEFHDALGRLLQYEQQLDSPAVG